MAANEEQDMSNDTNTTAHDDADRQAYNAAFHALGLRWHWDAPTYRRLLERSPSARERLRLYLESEQAHLLKAYDAAFLAGAIEAHKVGRPAAASVNWAAMQCAEIGV
jgi:hypothetical protein